MHKSSDFQHIANMFSTNDQHFSTNHQHLLDKKPTLFDNQPTFLALFKYGFVEKYFKKGGSRQITNT